MRRGTTATTTSGSCRWHRGWTRTADAVVDAPATFPFPHEELFMRCRHLVPILALALGAAVSVPAVQAAADTVTPPAEGPWTAAHDASPAFAPDGDTVVFTRGSGTA